jgi:hypothetical protein
VPKRESLGLPVAGSFGGGKSGFRRIHSHLQGLCEGLLSQPGEQVSDLFLATADDLPGQRTVDRVGDFANDFLHALPQSLDVPFPRNLLLPWRRRKERDQEGVREHGRNCFLIPLSFRV